MGPADLKDRVERGEAGWAAVGSSSIGKFADVPGEYRLIEISDGGASAAEAAPGAARYTESAAAAGGLHPGRPDHGRRNAAPVFHLGHHVQGQARGAHSHVLPVGHLSTMYWIGLEPGDVHLNVASPGWAKHAWSNVFTPWIAEARVFVYNYERFDARALMEQMDREKVTSFCARPRSGGCSSRLTWGS